MLRNKLRRDPISAVCENNSLAGSVNVFQGIQGGSGSASRGRMNMRINLNSVGRVERLFEKSVCLT